MFTEEDYKVINREFETLKMSTLKRCANQEEFELVLKAFDFANEAHKGVRRRSGEPYILHPISVARIVVQEIGLGYKSICAALLHDVVEDTNYTVEDIKNHFGQKIASLVDGLTKIKTALDSDNITYSKSMQVENFKRILLTLNDDVRIVLIKLADRLHNMRTIRFMPEYKRDKILSETMYIFIPLVHRLGLYSIKSEMENIWLVHREPEAYKEIEAKLETVMEERAGSIDSFVVPIEKELEAIGYKVEILKRLKTPYSIWKKMTAKNVPFEQIFDIYAVRIIFEAKQGISEREQCWQIFSLITERYQYKPDRTRDWVKEPKSNGYEALHLTVMGPGGKWIEVQIRSERMNSIAERGVAAHWMYKKGESSPSGEVEIDIWLKHVRDILEDPDSNALQFLDNFHKELLSSDIYIFTPKGESKTLPKGSTALDFAYNIHTQVGNKAIAAKVNQKLLPLSHVLSNGDQVEIITSDSGKPKREWLNFVRTNRARNFILDSIKAETKDSIKEGRLFLTSKLKERNITTKSRVIKKLIDYYKAGSKDELYHKIGIGLIDLSDLETALKTNVEKRNVQMWGVKLLTPVRNTGIIDKQQDYELREDLSKGTTTFTIAECCSPIPGDNVVGFIEDDGSVLVHKKSCQKATDIAAKQGDRIVSAKWSKHFMMSYLARISITGLDRMGIISDMSKVISLQLGVNMRKISIETHDEIFEGTVDLYVRNTDDLDKLIKSLSAIKGIESVKRVELNFNE
ncbi:MAG: bifunctional (p)ppGpp synthetase/guanosine-3',5'-bis(diphosphate) 3'-pyrophosphohydrolase [Bacteroidales bacterium]|jgi:GTP pyrophosphokinase|nr:bifunctional (p)ppGpp synthetase/guanosine-3',5'-bis(diphosphate) 3'-pyrophosphohydrolase [Bacteroidales bacterium]HPB89567.1 RelA/SpoT family protein [Bacteroidales bacterium]HQN24290.1 RelA/SpoT family protein [Bacteroidales bacterium]